MYLLMDEIILLMQAFDVNDIGVAIDWTVTLGDVLYLAWVASFLSSLCCDKGRHGKC